MTVTQQVSLIPAGCQPWNLNVAASCGTRFAYAATLAIYIFEFNDKTNQFYLHSIMSEHKKTITSLAWHPTDCDIIASSGTDFRVFVWHVAKHRVLAVLTNPFTVPILLTWYPKETYCLTYCDGKGPIYIWRYNGMPDDVNAPLQAPKEISSVVSPVVLLCWHHSVIGQLALGHADGSISICMPGQKPQLHVRLCAPDGQNAQTKQGSSVSSLLWDPFSANYLLFSCTSGYIGLVDVSSKPITAVSTYTAPSKAVAIKCVSWLTEAPGAFISGDAEAGVLRIWTVSREKPLENIRLKQTGFQALCVMETDSIQSNAAPEKYNGSKVKFSSRIVCLFVDGGIGVYSLKFLAWEFYRDMGHLETIFDCQFKPDNCDLLATASFDGTIKLWNVNTMESVGSSPGDESIIYSISWAPPGMEFLVASTSKRGIFIWNISKGCITKRIDDHGKGVYVYAVAWNQKDARKIASGGADGTCMVHQSDGKLLNTFKHPATVYGCDWNPQNEAIIATACEDGNIRVFYDGAGTTSPLKTLTGHTGKVFRVKWSPLKESILCSTSDDCSVRVWDYSVGATIRTLLGHTNCTRGLLWSPELPNILLSGSWDYTVRVWDTSDGSCLDVIEDHGADVYGLACHPARPFVFASTSRDSTVRLWSVLPLVSLLFVKALAKRPWSEIFSPAVTEKTHLGAYLGLYGFHSTSVRDTVIKSEDRFCLKTMKALSSLFCPPNGVANLWDLASVLKDEDLKSDHYGTGIVHRKHAVGTVLAEAHEKELVKMTRYGAGGVGAPSKDECLRAAAEHYLLAGNLRKYCELKTELGEWCHALAVAPGVSVKYWQELASRWISTLMEENSNQIVPLAIATGNVELLIEFYKKQNCLEKSYMISVALSEGLIKSPNSYLEDEKEPGDKKPPADYEQLITENTYCRTEKYLLSGSPVVAACCQLAIGNIQEAVQPLLRGNELELAVALSMALNYEGPSLLSAVSYLSWRCARKGEWELALDILDLHPNANVQKAQICANCGLSLPERNELYRRAGLPPVDMCATKAVVEHENNGNILEVVQYYLLSNKAKTGLDLGLQYVKDSLNTPSWKVEPVWQVLSAMSAVRPHVLQDNSCDRHRFELQIYGAYVGALVAWRQGFIPVVAPLLSKSLSIIRQVHNLECSLSEDFVEGSFQAWMQSQRMSKESLNENLKEIYNEMKSKAFEAPPFGDVGVTTVTGSHLPRHSDQHNCYLRGNTIQGPVFFLEDCKSVISLNDALMWAKVNRFSPLGTGLPINPF